MRDEEYMIRMERFDDSAIKEFSAKVMTAASGAAKDKNLCFSPLSLYFAISSVALGAKGDAKTSLLRALGYDSTQALAEDCSLIGDEMHPDDLPEEGTTENPCRLEVVNGIWANSALGYSFREHYADYISEIIDTDCLSSDLSAGDAGDELASWVAQKTDGFLDPHIEIPPESAMVLASLLYFKGIWYDEFDPNATTKDLFHISAGADTAAEFMQQVDDDGCVHRGAGYIASRLSLGLHNMTFVLPDDGADLVDILSPSSISELLSAEFDERAKVSWSVPKFDISSSLNISRLSSELGIECLFSPSDCFEDMLEGPYSDKTFLSSFTQESRLAIDEKGCEASSLSVSHWVCLGMRPQFEDVKMRLDRPFAFILSEHLSGGYDGKPSKDVPLMFGIVRHPNA